MPTGPYIKRHGDHVWAHCRQIVFAIVTAFAGRFAWDVVQSRDSILRAVKEALVLRKKRTRTRSAKTGAATATFSASKAMRSARRGAVGVEGF